VRIRHVTSCQVGAKVHARFELLGTDMQPTGELVTHVCDALVGCDGIKSAVRRQLYPEDQVQYAGLMLWRATTLLERPFLGGDTMFMAGTNDAKLVAYPISREAADKGKSLVNWIAETYVRDFDVEKFGYSVEAQKSDFRHRFEGWGRGAAGSFWSAEAAAAGEGLDIQALIEGAEQVFAYPMVDRDPLARWSFGGVTLLGDAAHAMRPNGSNGATQAILDARELAACLGRVAAAAAEAAAHRQHEQQQLLADSVASALRAYQEARLGPTTRVVLANRATGPERVLQMAADEPEMMDAPARRGELEAVIADYRKLAGFDISQVNERYEAWAQAQAQARPSL
jgi:2-polyprenyl-6-methoxyphenol hydroxylase-like FAD-dependent oxidoreductase